MGTPRCGSGTREIFEGGQATRRKVPVGFCQILNSYSTLRPSGSCATQKSCALWPTRSTTSQARRLVKHGERGPACGTDA